MNLLAIIFIIKKPISHSERDEKMVRLFESSGVILTVVSEKMRLTTHKYDH